MAEGPQIGISKPEKADMRVPLLSGQILERDLLYPPPLGVATDEDLFQDVKIGAPEVHFLDRRGAVKPKAAGNIVQG